MFQFLVEVHKTPFHSEKFILHFRLADWASKSYKLKALQRMDRGE